MRFLSILGLMAICATSLFAACGKGGGGGEGGDATGTITCDPGENIFCKCPGGDPGTKACKADGHSFEACVTRFGPCPDVPTTTSTSEGGSGGTGTGTGGTGTGGTGTGGTGPVLGGYLDACATDEDCQSGKCPYGYCTKDCAKFDECTLGKGECIAFQGQQICMPVCVDTTDCIADYAPPSACGYTTAVDGTPVTTCTDWLASLKVPPNGTNCEGDLDCNLGNEGQEAVCSFGGCIDGCFGMTDCPTAKSCTSNGSTPGHCQ